jgi:hypothetical protein
MPAWRARGRWPHIEPPGSDTGGSVRASEASDSDLEKMTPSRDGLTARLRIPPYLLRRAAPVTTDPSVLPGERLGGPEWPSLVVAPKNETQSVDPGLRRMRQAGLAIFFLELVGFGVWSDVVWQRFSLTWDFSLLYGATTHISHSSFGPALQTVEEHFDAVILWPLAWLTRLPGHGLLLLWAQDLAVAVAGAVAYVWVCEILERPTVRRSISPKWLAGLALVLLVANPWIFLTPAFDFHLEAFGTVFIVLAARALYWRRIGISLLWVAATLTCGFVAATYVGGLAIGALIVGKNRQRLVGLGLLASGGLGVFAMTVIGQGQGFLSETYGYLVGSRNPSLMRLISGVASHPATALRTLWSERIRIYANLLPAGLLGVFSGWGLGFAVVLILANILQDNEGLRAPAFQWLPVYLFVGVGTIMVLAKLSSTVVSRLGQRTVVAVAVVLAVNTLGWSVVWAPKLPGEYLLVSPSAARVLHKLNSMIPANAPVIVAQGVVGQFPSHPNTAILLGSETSIPKGSGPIWVVLAPTQGSELVYSGIQQALVTELGDSGNATLVAHGAGIWGFRWSPPSSTRVLRVPASTAAIAGWSATGPAGRSVLAGSPQNWAAVSNGQSGYVVSGDYFERSPGTYQAKVKLSVSGPATVEAWDQTGNALLAKVEVAPASGPIVVSFPVTLHRLNPRDNGYAGWGPFQSPPAFVLPGNDLQLRVWQAGGHQVIVDSLSLTDR